MNILLVCSNKDIASINFKEEILNNYNLINKDNLFKIDLKDSINSIYLKIIDSLHIFSKQEEIIEKKINFELIIFLSKHSTLSENKPKCMTVHSIGNWGKAELGGKDNCVVKTDPVLIRNLLLNLKENKPKELKEYEVKQEATHHGPYIDIRSIFYEIGSCEIDWINKKVSRYMIKILIDTLKNYNQEEIIKKNNWILALGVGGNHYCTKFNRYTFNRDKKYCFGHVVANYNLKDINTDSLKKAKEESNLEKIIYEEDL